MGLLNFLAFWAGVLSFRLGIRPRIEAERWDKVWEGTKEDGIELEHSKEELGGNHDQQQNV